MVRLQSLAWLSYDRMFREHVEKEPSSNWSLLYSIFYSLSFLSQRVEASTCPKCMGSNHTKHECALTALEPQQSLRAVDPWRIHDSQVLPGSVFVVIPLLSLELKILPLQRPSVMRGNVSDTQSLATGNTSS